MILRPPNILTPKHTNYTFLEAVEHGDDIYLCISVKI